MSRHITYSVRRNEYYMYMNTTILYDPNIKLTPYKLFKLIVHNRDTIYYLIRQMQHGVYISRAFNNGYYNVEFMTYFINYRYYDIFKFLIESNKCVPNNLINYYLHRIMASSQDDIYCAKLVEFCNKDMIYYDPLYTKWLFEFLYKHDKLPEVVNISYIIPDDIIQYLEDIGVSIIYNIRSYSIVANNKNSSHIYKWLYDYLVQNTDSINVLNNIIDRPIKFYSPERQNYIKLLEKYGKPIEILLDIQFYDTYGLNDIDINNIVISNVCDTIELCLYMLNKEDYYDLHRICAVIPSMKIYIYSAMLMLGQVKEIPVYRIYGEEGIIKLILAENKAGEYLIRYYIMRGFKSHIINNSVLSIISFQHIQNEFKYIMDGYNISLDRFKLYFHNLIGFVHKYFNKWLRKLLIYMHNIFNSYHTWLNKDEDDRKKFALLINYYSTKYNICITK